MTQNEIKSLALKLGSLFILFQILIASSIPALSLAYTLTEAVNQNLYTISFSVIGFIAYATPLALSYFLWKYSNSLSENKDETNITKNTDVTHNNTTVEKSIITGVGVLLLGICIPDFIQSTALMFTESAMTPTGIIGEISLGTTLLFVGTLIQLVFSLTLIFGSTGWVNLFHKLRYAGLN